jgi:hypothetical protein
MEHGAQSTTGHTILAGRTGAAFPRLLALGFGIGYLVLGLAGFFFAGEHHIGRNTANVVWIFSVGTLANILHTVIGALGILAASRSTSSRVFGYAMFFVFAGLTAYGILAAATAGAGDLVNINWADNWLHGLSALAGLAMALLPLRRSTTRAQDRPPR